MLWGLTYVLNEQIYKKIHITTSLAITCAATSVALFIFAFNKGLIKRDFTTIFESKSLTFLILVEIVIFIFAEIFIALSISTKNATLAGLIEISYPVFIALFAYILYRENSINTTTLVGASLIFIGVFTIYHFNQ